MELGELAHIWLIVCPLVFLGGLIDAVAGGGGLITLPAYLLAGLPAHMASGTNKCGNAFGTFLSTGRFVKRGDVHIPSAAAGEKGVEMLPFRSSKTVKMLNKFSFLPVWGKHLPTQLGFVIINENFTIFYTHHTKTAVRTRKVCLV